MERLSFNCGMVNVVSKINEIVNTVNKLMESMDKLGSDLLEMEEQLTKPMVKSNDRSTHFPIGDGG